MIYWKWAWQMRLVIISIFLFNSTCMCSEENQHAQVFSVSESDVSVPIGHLEPLGAAQSSKISNLTSTNILPDPILFYKNHVTEGVPVVFLNVGIAIPALQLWKDDYLRKNYGNLSVNVEVSKKENRATPPKTMVMKEFLDQYQKEDLYMVHHITGDMIGEISLPRHLQCGGFQKMLVESVLWLSSGGTRSVLHNDEFNNFNCLLEGRKDIILIDKTYRNQVEEHGFIQQGHYSLVDVDKVDMYKFPGLREVTYYSVTLHPGDCIYIPAQWYHQVRSHGTRNMAFNIWFAQLLRFEADDCDKAGALPDFRSLKDYEFTGHIEQMRASMLEGFAPLDVVLLKDCLRLWQEKLKDDDIVKEVFQLIDEDDNGILSWHELYNFDVLEVARKFPRLFTPLSEENHHTTHSSHESGHSVTLNMPREEL